MKLTFYGGAGEVTGANYLLESGGAKILIDCGLRQGKNYCELPNFKPFPYNPKEISAVFVTHSHIDHTGRLPQLARCGFKERVISTPPAKDFAEAMLLDSEHVLLEEASHCGEKPLYTTEDIDKICSMWEGVQYHKKMQIGPFEIELWNAGHILGSSSVVVLTEGKRIVFSGDLGNIPNPFITDTEYIKEADYTLIESAYGDKIHEGADTRKEELRKTIINIIKNRGVLLIPTFALERTQEIIFELNDLAESKRIPRVPIFIDSPLAIKLTSVYQKYSRDPMYFNAESIARTEGGDAIFSFPGLKATLTTEESKTIDKIPAPKIVIAGAGMSQGGRIRRHEMRYLPSSKNTILFIGFQVQGSLGRRILEGAKTVQINSENVPVRSKVVSISGYSAHADQSQLMKWLAPMKKTLKKVFVVQGEEDQLKSLAQNIHQNFKLDAVVPSMGETVVL
ncbi:MAG: MBL fold metallo-hydrolase [Patescibacteria group bacterium]